MVLFQKQFSFLIVCIMLLSVTFAMPLNAASIVSTDVFSATPGNGVVYLKWSMALGSTDVGYMILKGTEAYNSKANENGEFEVLDFNVGQREYTDNDVDTGIKYYYYLMLVNEKLEVREETRVEAVATPTGSDILRVTGVEPKITAPINVTTVKPPAVPTTAIPAITTGNAVVDARTSQFVLELDGQLVGSVVHFEGGYPYADVEKTASGEIYNKKSSKVKYADIKLEVNIDMSKAFLQWLKDSFGSDEIRKNGSIIKLGYTSGPGGGEFEVYRLNFYNAFISEATFPDIGQNENATIKLVITSETTSRDTSRTNIRLQELRTMAEAQNSGDVSWRTNNFDTAFTGMNPVDPGKIRFVSGLKLQRNYTEDEDGNKVLGVIEVSNLMVTLKDSAALSFYNWLNDSVISNEINERNVSIIYKAMRDRRYFSIATLDLEGVGILKIEPLAQGTEYGDQGYVMVEMYAEDCILEIDPNIGF